MRVEPRPAQYLSRYRQLIGLLLLTFACSDCLFARIVYYNKPTLGIVDDFDERTVRASSAPLPIPRSDREAQFPLTATEHDAFGSLEALLSNHATRAFL